MGWGSGINREGRDVGYTVEATCDQEGCETKIDRGLYYVCGGMHDGAEHGCGHYFCGEHLAYYWDDEDKNSEAIQLCAECGQGYEASLSEDRAEASETSSRGPSGGSDAR